MFNAGNHVPVIPFKEIVGKAAKFSSEQIAGTALNVGVTFGFTVIVIVVDTAHESFGVKVYVVVATLFNAGDHVPEIPFKEIVGKADKLSPEQIAGTALNVGVIPPLTVIVNVVACAQELSSGVNVYVVVCILFKAGDHVPDIPLLEINGKAVNAVPSQIAATGSNVGIADPTATVIVIGVAHTQ